ncbi:RAQPRD family integrative conjugative element protein [Pseudomonas sp. GOM7]|uniref:integrative conjugative element protein, RAQPRD family n=1 Tax=Pseudomonas sp. GOM7 TaxID=2998079 RepID=UPI00227D632D|nr:RAQPRD family integrative conjugative element protein [Pseudomonas sp. GOM7]WAJ37264.1 RAQPRD family integrative conjugative element protein [Pseudomonas sp. GOM7]
MQPSHTYVRRVSQCFVLAGVFLLSAQTWASGNPQEIREISLALKQLENVKAIIKRAQAQARASRDVRGSRYELDYDLIQSDLTRIEAGLQGYLAPSRAQPRDIQEITGDYSRDRGAPQ